MPLNRGQIPLIGRACRSSQKTQVETIQIVKLLRRALRFEAV
jgi:hypothetical protein